MYYGIKPYYMVIFHYIGGPNFRVEIYNECAVKISYRNETFNIISKDRATKFKSPVQNIGLLNADFEIEKIRETLTFNANGNFLVSHEYRILKTDLISESEYQVFHIVK